VSSPASLIARKLGHYRIVEQIGAGGMGVVYRARDERLQRDVAVKVLPTGVLADDNARKRFRTEALALSRLNHPNIATVHDFDSDQGIDFIVTELVPGQSLDQRLTSGPLSQEEGVRIAEQLADGLDAAHRQGIVHRDLKPANLRLTPDGRLKILDFGLAKRVEAPEEATLSQSLAEAGVTAGTLPYMAPEQLRGEAADPRTDIWSAGVVLYELATGRRPFTGNTEMAIADQVLHASPPPIPAAKLSPALSAVLARCLEKDPAQRYSSAKELLADLRRAQVPGARVTAAPLDRRRYALAGVAIAALAIAIVIPALLYHRAHARSAGVPHIESLAVLPLQNFSGDPQQEYFVDGMTDELITQLAQGTSLRVISRSSVMQYKKTNKTIPQIAKELQVDAVLEGSAERVGDHVRIQAQLIYGPEDRHLWAQQYDRQISDVLALQDEVARAISQEVGGKLSGTAVAKNARPVKVDPRAYEAYLRGRDAQSISKAIGYFDQAIALQPDFAPPYAAKATVLFFAGFFGMQRPNEAFPKVEQAAQKAIELDPDLAEGHDALALAKLQYDWDFAGAEREFRRALELNPSNADVHHMYGHYLLAMGRIDESVKETRLAARLDPAGESFLACLGWHEISGRHYENALSDSRRILPLAGDDFWVHLVMGWAFEQQKRYDDATAELRQAENLSGGASIAEASLAHVLAVSGKRAEAHTILAKMQTTARTSYVPAYDFAVLYLGLGDKQSALAWLQKASVERSGFLVYINWDPRFDVLRSDARFTAILRQIGLPTKIVPERIVARPRDKQPLTASLRAR
jgi:eukaryotic-like serine/threonine-protein kinase